MALMLSVSEFNQVFKAFVESEPQLSDIWVIGEISNLKFYQKGSTFYFTLSDADAQLNCVLYGNFAQHIAFKLENGLHVAVRGKLQFYHKRGSVTFQAAYMTLHGEGQLAKQFEQLKQKLSSEGVFDAAHKQAIPPYPMRIGLITANGSAALQDFIKIQQQFCPFIQCVVIPAVMQGALCPGSVKTALDMALTQPSFDVMVILRGGGSAEDLSGFNEESLIRAVFSYPIPVVSAVGHEVDVTLLDLVADLRCPTPSAAAYSLCDAYRQFLTQLPHRLYQTRLRLNDQLASLSETAGSLLSDVRDAVSQRLLSQDTQIAHLIHRLDQASPLKKLRQGYSISRQADTGSIIRSVQAVHPNDKITLEWADGSCLSVVQEVKVSAVESDAVSVANHKKTDH